MLEKLLESLHRIFPIRTSLKVLPSTNPNERPCLNYHMGKCKGCCINEISQEDYLETVIQPAKLVLSGRLRELRDRLSARMEQASIDVRFEEGAAIRDQIKLIREIESFQQVVLREDTDRDVLGMFETERKLCLIVLVIREGRMINKYDYTFDRVASTEKMLED